MLHIVSTPCLKKPPAASRAGFSLLEVIASLVITTLLIVALTPLVNQMLATWSRGSEIVSMVELQRRGLGVLRDDLTYAVAWRGFGRTDEYLAFRGNETSMSFPAVSGLGHGRDGLEMISIEVTNSAGGRALIRRRAAIIGSTRTAFADPVVIYSGPYKYFFRYYSQDGDEKAVWADPYSLPARVVLNIVNERDRYAVLSIPLPLVTSISSACFVTANLPSCPIRPQQSQVDPMLNAMGISSQ